MSALENLPGPAVEGVLLDIDGTILVDDRPVAGAAGVLERLDRAGIRMRYLSNTSRRGRSAIAIALGAAGIPCTPATVLTPAVLARRLVLSSDRPTAALFVAEEARADFAGIEEDAAAPGWVVLGDLGDGFTHDALSRAFRLVRDGAAILALHRQRSWRPAGREEVLDVGAYVAALEYATGKPARLVGKPAADFFRLALEEIGLDATRVVMVGDDPESDAFGARGAGLRSILVRTGKPWAAGDPIPVADLILDSVAALL